MHQNSNFFYRIIRLHAFFISTYTNIFSVSWKYAQSIVELHEEKNIANWLHVQIYGEVSCDSFPITMATQRDFNSFAVHFTRTLTLHRIEQETTNNNSGNAQCQCTVICIIKHNGCICSTYTYTLH